jgi:hypothetical protein
LTRASHGHLARVRCVLVGVVILSLASQVHAQNTPPASEPAPLAQPDAESPAAAQSKPASDSSGSVPYAEARARVAGAEKLFEDGNYDAALTEFLRAYETMEGHPSRHLVLYNVAQCYEKLYRYGAAIETYREYLDQGGDKAEDGPTVKAKIELLEGLLGTLKLTVVGSEGRAPAGYEVWIDGRKVETGVTSLQVPGGTHEIEIRASGYETAKQPVNLLARGESRLRFELVPLAKEYRGLHPAAFWTTASLAVVAAGAGSVFGIMATSERSDVDSALDAGPPRSLEVTESQRDRISNLSTTADIFFIGAGVLGVGAVVLGFLTDFDGEGGDEETAAEGTDSTASWDAVVLPGGGALNLRGAF